MDLLILAGGFGTRLKPVVSSVPKVMAPVNNIPFLHYQVENWVVQGIKSFVFLLYYQSDVIINYLNEVIKKKYKNCKFRWVIENQPLDTGGSVANAVKYLNLKKDFMLINSDTWIGNGISNFQNSKAPGIGVIQKKDGTRYGAIEYDSNFIIQKFTEKSKIKKHCWINAGLYYLNPSLFFNWNNLPFSLEKSLFVNCVQAKILKAIPLNTEFIDIGVPQDYARFCQWNNEGRINKL